MMTVWTNLNQASFRRKVLSQALLGLGILSTPIYAMQILDDESMSGATGEGVAFILDDVRMQFNGADDAGAGNAGTGYVRLIPVGALSTDTNTYNTAHPTTKIGKGDIYLYGLSISGNDNDVTTQLSASTVDLGTSANPWVISVQTVNTPNFNGTDKPLTYIGLEAPLLTSLLKSDGTLLAADPNNYNLKLGTWVDAFVRDPTKVEGNALQFGLNSIDAAGNRYINGVNAGGGLTLRENRLRLQEVINGVSLNGSSIKIFQTLDGADLASGLGTTYKSYNNTLGLAATLRMNSGDATSVRAPVYSLLAPIDETTSTLGTPSPTWSLLHGGWTTSLSTLQTATGAAATGGGGSCNNGGSVEDNTNFGSGGCQFMVNSRTRTDSKTRTVTKSTQWTAATGLDNHVMRFSTQEDGTTQGLLSTPAINGGAMPSFADTEGLFLYKPNINLVLGSQWQPLVLGVASDNKNLSLELTRIPDVANVYKKIYTDYTGADATYQGGTCSVYWCGGAGNGVSINATHSSITLGTTLYTAPVNTGANKTPLSVSAYKGADAAGVSFGSLNAVQGQTQTNTGSTNTSAFVTEAQWIQRVNDSGTTWNYSVDAVGDVDGGTANQWSYGGSVFNTLAGVTNATYQAASARYRYPIASGNGNTWSGNTTTAGLCGINAGSCTYYGTTDNRNWTLANYNSTYGLTFSTASNTALDTWLNGAASTSVSTNQALAPSLPVVTHPINAINLGSAVIDGLLIQHLKITTKGL